MDVRYTEFFISVKYLYFYCPSVYHIQSMVTDDSAILVDLRTGREKQGTPLIRPP